MHVLDRIRGMEGQVTPQSVKLREIVNAYDDEPMRELERSYDALLAYLEDEKTSAPAQVVADRRAARPEDIERARAEYKNLTRETVTQILSGELTPAQRIGLRM